MMNVLNICTGSRNLWLLHIVVSKREAQMHYFLMSAFGLILKSVLKLKS